MWQSALYFHLLSHNITILHTTHRMKKQLLLFVILLAATQFASAQTQSFHDFSARSITGQNIDFSDYYGKKVMVVNTASFCGFTPQFEDLQALYDQYQSSNFEILGFPCNDFNNQDPNADSTILEFCTSEYGVTFQMMSKIIAVLPDTSPVFRWLQEGDLNGVADAPITWNFHKFLIDEAGDWVAHHGSNVNPNSSVITDWINSPSALSVIDHQTTNVELLQLLGGNTHDQLQLYVQSPQLDKLNVELLALDGKHVAQLHAGPIAQAQIIRFNASQLPAGLYLIRATNDQAQQTLRYTVTR